METVVGDISGAIQQLKDLSDVTLEWCCDELTRGVVEGLRRKRIPQHQVSSSPGKPVIATHRLVYVYFNYNVCTRAETICPFVILHIAPSNIAISQTQTSYEVKLQNLNAIKLGQCNKNDLESFVFI